MGKNKRSRSYYIQPAKRQKNISVLGADMAGFLCTCNFHERECVREAYNVLNEFADKLYGKEFPEKESEHKESSEIFEAESSTAETKTSVLKGSDSDEEILDIDAEIKADVSALKRNHDDQKKVRRFQQVQCGAKNCVFIQTTVPDPVELSLSIMDDILHFQKQRTQKLLRMIPVQVTCKAFPEDIEKAVEKLASSYFKEKSSSYCVVFKIRNNSSIKKDTMVPELANILQKANSNNKPVLIEPEIALNVDIIKNVCCLSLLPYYYTKYSKYNLVSIANKNKNPSGENIHENLKSTEHMEESTSAVQSDTANVDGRCDKTENDSLESGQMQNIGTKANNSDSTETNIAEEKSTESSVAVS